MTTGGYLRFTTIMGAFDRWVNEDFPSAFNNLACAVQLAEQTGDILSLVLATFYLACTQADDCKFEEGFANLEKAFTINTAVNNLWGMSVMKSFQSLCQFWKGLIGLSYQTAKQAVSLADQSGDIYSGSFAHAFYGISCYGRGNFEEAVEELSRGADLGERVSHFFVVGWARFILAEAFAEIGQSQVAKDNCQNVFNFIHQHALSSSFSMNTTQLNLVRMALVKAEALSDSKTVQLDQLHLYIHDNRVKVCEGWSRRYLAEILLILDNQYALEAQHWIEEAMEADERNGMRWHLARDISVYAELFKRKGDTFRAKEQLGKAIDIYKDCGADGWVTRAEEEMAKLQ